VTFRPLTHAEIAEDAAIDLPPWMDPMPDHISASQLSMFQRCPEQWRRRYLLGQKERPGGALVWGSADHYAHEQNFTQKITSGVDIPRSDVELAFVEGFDRAIERNGGAGEIVWDDKPGSMKDQGVALVGAYHDRVSPHVQPVTVEEKFKLQIPGVPVPVIGYVDVTTAETGIERKTAKRKESKPKPDWVIQGRLYQAVKHLPIEWHLSVKTKVPGIYAPGLGQRELSLPLVQATVDSTMVLVRTLAQAMLAYMRMYGPHEPWPGGITHPWACDFCGFRPTCAWWAGENSLPPTPTDVFRIPEGAKV
jgi:hypothetical protein